VRSSSAIGLLLALLAPPACGTSDGRIVQVGQTPPADDALGPLGSQLDVDERIDVAGLDAPVDIVRDRFGIVHIYATTPRDAFRVEGWMMAKDRAPQLEMLRRTAQGRLAESFGDIDPSLIDQDIAVRTLGLTQAGQASYEALAASGEPRLILDAFADGVSQYFASLREGRASLPALGTVFPPDDFSPWSPADSLAIAALYAAAVSLPAVQELAVEQIISSVPLAFPADSADLDLARRARVLPDLLRFEPIDSATVLSAATGRSASSRPIETTPPSTRVDQLAPFAGALDAALARIGRYGKVGSNAWAVAPARSASAHALLASDPHFRMTSPAAPWLVHLEVSADGFRDDPLDLHVAGAAMVGLPAVAYGFNRYLAWGAAASQFDTADLYRETLSPDGRGVVWSGADVPFDRRAETVFVRGRDPVVFDVLSVPHHGPVLPRIQGHAVLPPDSSAPVISVRWFGFGAGSDFEASLALLRAASVDDARAANALVQDSGLSYVFADASGHIGYAAHARVPRRNPAALAWDARRASGQLPCRVLPGDGSSEWTGLLDDVLLPGMVDPEDGFVVLANADPVGGTLDGDPTNDTIAGAPVFFGCSFDPGFRQGRIQELLAVPGRRLGAQDLSAIQADVRSPIGARMASVLVAALDRASKEREQPGTFPSLTAIATSDRFAAANIEDVIDVLDAWAKTADYRASAGVKLADAQPSADLEEAVASKATLVFNAWLVRFAQRTLGDEAARLGFDANLPESMLVRALVRLLDAEPSLLASYDPAMRDSILWDDLGTEEIESRDEIAVSSLLDVLAWLEVHLGSQRDEWRWGRMHTAHMEAMMPGMAGFDIPPATDAVFPDGFPRPGDLYAVNAAPYDLTPSSIGSDVFHATDGAVLRLVVEMAPAGPLAQAVIAGGQVADPSDPHFRDDAEYWRHDRTHDLPFEQSAVLGYAQSRIVARVRR
jgi:penicillin amidase